MENLEYIESYIQGRLSESERLRFEQKLVDEPQFKNEYEQTLQLITVIEADGLKSQLKHYDLDSIQSEDEDTNESSKIIQLNPRNNIRKIILIAASFALLISAGLWVFNQDNQQDRMMAEVFYTDPGLPTPMSEVNHYNFYDAMVDYKLGDYRKALDKWKMVSDGIGEDTLEYYRAMALIQLNNIAKAEVKLSSIDPTSDLFQKAQWRKLEALIKEGKLKEAQDLIETLPEDINPEYSTVRDFLKTNK